MRAKEFLEGPHDPYTYKAIFFAGSPGAGKTYVARKLAGVFGGLKQVNMDIIFKHLMTKKNLSWKMPPEEEPEREKQRELDEAMKNFLAKGGKVEKVKPKITKQMLERGKF